MDNPWARDDEVIEGQATASAPFSSPPLRTFARLSVGEDDWGAAHRSSPSDRQAGSGWEHPESVKFGGSSKDEEERDVPWASEIDPSALHFPSAIPVFEQHSQSDYGHERPETARHSGDSQTYSNENNASLELQRQGGCTPPWQASSPVHGSSGPNSRRASLGGSDTKSTDWKDEDSEDDWGKMDLPPLRPSVNGPDPSHQAEEENWPSMDLPPSKTELHRDALPVWDLPTVKPATTSRQRSAGNEGDANQVSV